MFLLLVTLELSGSKRNSGSMLTLFQLFTPVISLIKSNMAVPVLGGAVVCTGELCQSLVLSAVPEIPKFMPAILKVLADVELVKA